MFGYSTRVVAVVAISAHLWVNWVVAPWHHWAAHRPAVAQPASQISDVQPVHRCRCRHHAQRRSCAANCDQQVPKSSDPGNPVVPHQNDDCQICQILAQPCTTAELPALVLAMDRVPAVPPASVIQPLFGDLIDPVSRGPPA